MHSDVEKLYYPITVWSYSYKKKIVIVAEYVTVAKIQVLGTTLHTHEIKEGYNISSFQAKFNDFLKWTALKKLNNQI